MLIWEGVKGITKKVDGTGGMGCVGGEWEEWVKGNTGRKSMDIDSLFEHREHCRDKGSHVCIQEGEGKISTKEGVLV